MASCKHSEESVLQGPLGGVSLKAYAIHNVRERDLPPLPDEIERENVPEDRRPPERRGPFAIPLKISPPRRLASLPTKTPEPVLPTLKSSPILRPKMRLDTGWDARPHPIRLHSSDDVSSTSWHSASQFHRSIRSTAARDDLLLVAPRAYCALPAPDPPPRRPPGSRLLDAVRIPKVASVVRAAQKKAATPRVVAPLDPNLERIVTPPFMRSDAGPLHGVTVTVHRHCVVSEPMPYHTPGSSSSSLLPCARAEEPFPTPVPVDVAGDLPALPCAGDEPSILGEGEAPWDEQSTSRNDRDEDEDAHASLTSGTLRVYISPPTPASTIASFPAIVHVGRPPSGAKRRKHYRVHHAPRPGLM
ncbi:hypothetical protein B0H15DRAFT_507854 [Mycena belliarum]|uniref:Uncharacterized protein n=1 Tax=Mycena belliarum TaxID=1033014 RepID=A0AAD6UH03_9AGAR|nr:hypothetical protein B0H15DRAFT_507854 [Mycena belliae]